MVSPASLGALLLVIGALQPETTPQSDPSRAPRIGYDVHREQEWQRSVAFYNDGRVGSGWSAESFKWTVEVRQGTETPVIRLPMQQCEGLSDLLARAAQADAGQFSLPGIISDNGKIARRVHGARYRFWGSTRDEQGFGGEIAIWPTGEMASALDDLDRRVRERADRADAVTP